MSKRKRKSVDYTELDGPEAEQASEQFGLTQELDKIQLRAEIARPEQLKTFPRIFTVEAGDRKES